MKVYKGIVKQEIYEEYENKNGGGLFNYAANSSSIEEFLAVAYVLCPDIIEINGYIFISDLFGADGEKAINKVKGLEQQFEGDKKNIEQWVNSWSFGDFFIGKYCNSMENEKIIKQFGQVLVYNWSKRVKELFPNKNIVVEVVRDIMGELGLSITMYEQL